MRLRARPSTTIIITSTRTHVLHHLLLGRRRLLLHRRLLLCRSFLLCRSLLHRLFFSTWRISHIRLLLSIML